MDLIGRIKARLRWAREDRKARKRGEARVAPRGVTGRIYARQSDAPPADAGAMAAKGEPQASISARVYRAAENRWYDLGVIAEPRQG